MRVSYKWCCSVLVRQRRVDIQALWVLPIRASAAAEAEVLQDLLLVLCSAIKDVVMILPEAGTR